MTTQAVTPASAAAGLGLLMHPNMLMMHQMNAMQQMHANQLQAATPNMQAQMGLMMQQMQQAAAHQQAAGGHQPAVSLPPMTSPLTSSALTSSPLTSSSIASSPFGKSLFNPAGLGGLQQHSQAAVQAAAAVRQGSPSQIVPTNPLINSRATLDSIGAQVKNFEFFFILRKPTFDVLFLFFSN